MGKQKTIFDLFRQEDEQFSSQPSNEAWSKLESKLDEKKEVVTPVRRINWWTIAASLVALVGAVFVLQTSSNKSASKVIAENAMTEEASVFYVEDLVHTDAEDGFQKEWQVSNQYRALFADYEPDFQKNEDLAFNNAAKIKPRINQKPQNRAEPNYQIAAKRNNAKTTVNMADEALIAEKEVSKTTTEALEVTPTNRKVAASESYEYNDQTEDASGISMNMDAPPAAPATVRKSKSIVKKINDLSDLQWMVGKWEQKRADMKSVENWVADSSNTIWGTGYLLQEDDTIFTENMSIKQIDDKIYFFQNIDSVNEQTKFVLTSNTTNNWIFTNSGGVPKNLIISNPSASKYQLEIQNIAPTQTHFLRQRNILQSNNAFRQMNKVD